MWRPQMKLILLAAMALFLIVTGCTSYSPGWFDFNGPYPLVRYADGTEYELPSGNGHH